MSNRIEIINVALARLGESPIQDLDEGSVSARSAKLLYDSSRKAALRDYNWAFAITRESLVRYVETPDDFSYAYGLPLDCLRVIRLRGGASFVVRGGKLFTNHPSPILEYVRDVRDESLFDAKFVEALTYKLASDLAMPVKGSAELMGNYHNAYRDLLQQAAAESSGEQHRKVSQNPYVEARG